VGWAILEYAFHRELNEIGHQSGRWDRLAMTRSGSHHFQVSPMDSKRWEEGSDTIRR